MYRERVQQLGDDWDVRGSGLVVPSAGRQGTSCADGDWNVRGSGLAVPPGLAQPPVMRGMDFFCGAGGMSLGVIQAGIQIVAALEADEAATLTYTYNLGAHPMKFHFSDNAAEARMEKYFEKHAIVENKRGGVRVLASGGGWRASTKPNVPGVEHFFFGDIRKFTPRQVMDAMGIKPGELDLIVGGPPCQGYSHAGKRDVMDPRNSLVFEFAHFVVAMRPTYMVFENVPGIVSMVTPEGLPVIDVFCQILADGEYGSYETIRKSLTNNLPKSARMAVRKRGKAGKPKAEGQSVPAAPAQAQLALDF